MNRLFAISCTRAVSGLLIAAAMTMSGCQSLSVPGFGSGGAAQPELPAAVRSQFEAAVAAQRDRQWPEAERQFEQLLEKYPYLSGPALNLALIYAQTQRPQLAEEYFKRALTINPDSAVAGTQYGAWLRAQGRFGEAETLYMQTLARNPDYADAHLNLAILYDLYLERLEPALEHYRRYLAISGVTEGSGVMERSVQGWVADLERRMQRAGGAS